MQNKNKVISPEELSKQQVFIDELKAYNDGKDKKYMINTYGCQMNEHDSEILSGMIEQIGYKLTDNRDEVDLIIYNTCCVRENAELKVYGNLGALKNLKEKKKDLIIAVCGCMMQQPQVVDHINKKYSHVDLVFGTHNIHTFPQLLLNSMDSKGMYIDIWDKEGDIIEGLPINRKYGVKAFINIMYGCDNFCTYCIVPYTRGRERSRKLEDIMEEAKDLAKNGTKEITLLGQNVNSYGKTLEDNIDFADLLRELNDIGGIERIRFMTSHPKDLSSKLIDTIAECNKVCEHIHLPFQAGSNKTLKIMNRKYTKEGYLALAEKIKTKIPNATITTDVIVGFPGETEADFKDTMDIIEKVRFDSAYTFLYSIREGTPAAEMEGQVERSVKQERFNRLLQKVNEISGEINATYLDKVVEVLVEDLSKSDSNRLVGRTRQNKLVSFPGKEDMIGKLVNIKINECGTFSLKGLPLE